MATVQADYDLSGQPLSVEQQIPVDSDGDTIADAWEMMTVNGGRLDIAQDGNNNDGMWDEESTGSSFAGDKYTKLVEYMGFMVGPAHMRTNPYDARNVFASVEAAQISGAFALSGLQQLGVEVENVGSNFVYSLELGLSVPVTVVSRELNGTHSASDTGIFYQGVPTVVVQQVGPTLGLARVYDVAGQFRYGIGSAVIYTETIDNFYNHNHIPESFGSYSVPEAIYWEVPSTLSLAGSGKEIYVAIFDGSDLDPRPGKTDVNPFDIASDVIVWRTDAAGNDIATSAGNNPADGEIAGMTQNDAILRTGRHEMGHVAGLPHPCGTPGRQCTESTVMRQGIGPAKIDNFNMDDIQSSRIK